jgi:2'-5' RNA ligase
MGLGSRARLRAMGWRGNDRLGVRFSCLTTVVRVPERVAERIEVALEEVRDRWPGHAYYPPASIHVTVLNLDPYVAMGEGEGGEAAVIERAADLVGRHAGFRVTLRGLNVSPWTVFAQAYGADVPVARMRASLRGAFREREDAPRRDSPLRRAMPLVLANAVRFMGPVHPDLLRALRPWRAHTFGAFDVREVEIVRTDGFLSRDHTDVLSTVDVQPPLTRKG